MIGPIRHGLAPAKQYGKLVQVSITCGVGARLVVQVRRLAVDDHQEDSWIRDSTRAVRFRISKTSVCFDLCLGS